ncbi:MAG: Rne/Rng family ribonuclease [Gammaproteobacteria bacterium]|nr:Rne/Rng family ribonuclease [Gammaproteobacteria bacterium]
MKRMLFNATHPEELRVAIVDGQRLIDLDLESAVRAEKKGNIYKAVVTKVEPSLEAAFVDFGAARQGFLPLKEIYRGYFSGGGQKSMAEVKIAEEIKTGQEMVVQVGKDERGAKGAALTTFISLAGRFLVLMPNNPKGGGISRRVSGEERTDLREVVANLDCGERHALIARTAGIGREQAELQQDLDFLLKLWESIETAANELDAPRLIYQESNLIVRAMRDLAADIDEIVIDDREIHERASRFTKQVMPHNLSKLKHYEDSAPLFSRYQIERQIESAFNREVNLPSGGALVIDHGEAMIAVDVNSARATRGADIEETALQTNLEAVDELARQLRIRDLGGLVVIDLIDMAAGRNQRAVEARFREALKPDRARVQVGKISRFGLLEMSRQRLRASLSEANYSLCPRCEGTGSIRNVVSSSISLLRLIEDRARMENTEAIQVVLPLDMATYLLNEKRREVNQLEARLASRIIIIPSSELASPQFHIKRLRREEADELAGIPSYRQQIDFAESDDADAGAAAAPQETPHIRLDEIERDAAPARAASPGILRRLWNALFGGRGNGKPAPAERGKKGGGRARAKNGGQQPRGRGAPRRGAQSKGGRGTRGGRGGRGRGNQGERAAQPSSGGGGGGGRRQPKQSGGRSNKNNDSPARPTRRDFAAHEPEQRVGHRQQKAAANAGASNPNKTNPNRAQPERELPEDYGNR